MMSKGYLEIEVWHWNEVPVEYLGGTRLDMAHTRQGEEMERSIAKKAAKAKIVKDQDNEDGGEGDQGAKPDDDDDTHEDGSMGIHPGLSRKHKVKVYQASRMKLSGTWLQSVTKSVVSFSCYFIPDFPPDFNFKAQEVTTWEDGKSPFEASFQNWDTFWTPFMEAYNAWFPESMKADRRRFLARHRDSQGNDVPLSVLLAPLALPSSLMTPIQVQRWIRCMEFTVPPRQKSAGQFGSWMEPTTTLALHRGSIQDHAVLLCCALLGLRKDAFVCKGTVQGGKEHAWVMTREQNCVTFWETTTATRYHLAGRWLSSPALQRDGAKRQAVEQRWAARKSNPKWRELAERRAKMTREQHIEFIEDLVKLPISPWRELCKADMVTVIPYETLEVVFNGQNVWGNQCNHHPGCIYYDMEDDPKSWMPLVLEEARPELVKAQGIAIPVGPALSKLSVQVLEEEFAKEIKECIRMIRMRSGQETLFEPNEKLQTECLEYIANLEKETQLDSDWCYNNEDKLRRPWAAPSPFNSEAYVKNCQDAWRKFWEQKKKLKENLVNLPVKENHVLSGVALHLSTTNVSEIRYHVMNQRPLEEYLHIPMDEVYYFVCTKVYPMPASVASVWMFIGVELPLPQEKIVELAEAQRPDEDGARTLAKE